MCSCNKCKIIRVYQHANYVSQYLKRYIGIRYCDETPFDQHSSTVNSLYIASALKSKLQKSEKIIFFLYLKEHGKNTIRTIIIFNIHIRRNIITTTKMWKKNRREKKILTNYVTLPE